MDFRTVDGTDGALVVIDLDGDLVSRRDLLAFLDAIVTARCRRIVIDLTKVTFLDSAGLYALVATDRRLTEKGGRLHLVIGPWSLPERVLALSGLRDTLLVYDDVRDAISVAERHESVLSARRQDVPE